MKILVVDKQEELRAPADILWNTQGNEVLFASTGQQALDLVEGKHVDILITEVFMEPMNGFTLRNKMENRHPGMKTIFLTSFDLRPYAEHVAGYEVVAKPATAQKLLPAITRALGFAVKEEPATAPAPEPVSEPEAVVHEPEPEPEAIAPEPEPEPPAPVATPVAVPRAAAVPVATPRAVPAAVPRVAAAPAAQPVATPRAVAAPVARPAATPTPTARPIATPQAQPVPTARPATPTPQAVPTARPAAATPIPTARPASPAPQATPVPTARPAAPQASPGLPSRPSSPQAQPVQATPSARPVAVPKAAVPVATPRAAVPKAATPVATPRATPSATPRVPVAVPVAVPAGPDPLLGQTLGAYRIERRLGTGKWGAVYLATQTSVNRPVAMEVLSATAADNEQLRQDFVATARAKAAVQHSHILSVYEADHAGDYYFYTHEYVEGATLAELRARGEGLTEPVALQTIKFVAQGLAYLHQNRIGHSIPDSTEIYLGADALPYLSNVALGTAELPGVQDEIRAISAIVSAMLPGGQARDQGLRAMMARMAQPTQSGFQSWIALFQAIQAIEPKVIPADAFKLSAQDQAAIRAVEAARKRQKMQLILSIAGLFIFIWAVAIALWFEFMRPTVHDYSNEMIKIPAGTFTYGTDGQKITLPDFYIDKYEVTVAEYAKFLDFLKKDAHPTEFDSPQQPDGLAHTPPNWDIIWGRASSTLPTAHNYRGVPLTVDCPIFNVNYYDAFAYAKWKGRRLPTEQEWEKAARGPVGNAYPWGNDWDPKKLNSGADYQASPDSNYKPAVDGFCWWAPVTAFPDDRSPYGVIGMGGNVSEWTNSWDATKAYPVIRGGNFKSTPAQALTTAAIRDAGPLTTSETLGFRTASDKASGQ